MKVNKEIYFFYELGIDSNNMLSRVYFSINLALACLQVHMFNLPCKKERRFGGVLEIRKKCKAKNENFAHAKSVERLVLLP